jgi:hypothetical protein
MKQTIVFLLLLMLLSSTDPIQAQEDEYQFISEVNIEYGSNIQLLATLVSGEPPERATVFVRPASEEDTLVIQASIHPQLEGYMLDANLSMRPPPFNPFELLTIWWQVDFAQGISWESSTNSVRYEDNRFPWKLRTDNQIFVHWVDGEASRGEELFNLTTRSIANINTSLGLLTPGNIAIYIYPSVGDLRSGLQIGGAPWVEGRTLPELGVILIAAPDEPEALITLERDIPHELTHLLLYERMKERYNDLPAWLNEGLATLQETQTNPVYRFELEAAIEADALLTMESLCAAFPIGDQDALLAYAQSASFTRYLLDVYGMGGILELLDAYQEGATCTGAVQRIYQRSLTQLESEWRTLHLQAPSTWQRLLPILPWGLFLLLVLLLLLIGFSAKNRRPDSNRN